jgi:hypothetical protein
VGGGNDGAATAKTNLLDRLDGMPGFVKAVGWDNFTVLHYR